MKDVLKTLKNEGHVTPPPLSLVTVLINNFHTSYTSFQLRRLNHRNRSIRISEKQLRAQAIGQQERKLIHWFSLLCVYYSQVYEMGREETEGWKMYSVALKKLKKSLLSHCVYDDSS